MRLCDCCHTYSINYQINDEQLGKVGLCRTYFQKMDGALTLQRATIEHHHLDDIYERHRDSIERVKAELAKDLNAQLERMWELDSSHVSSR